MWADNETSVDLLGHEYLVDELVVALTEPRLLPLTLGLLGDWGSGKSSLLMQAAAELRAHVGGERCDSPDPENPDYLVVEFSPWQYEDYDDVKAALLDAVLDAILKQVPPEDEAVGRLRAFVRKFSSLGRRAGRMGARAAPAVVPLVIQAAAPDTDPAAIEVITAGTTAAAEEMRDVLADPAASLVIEPKDVIEFRRDFANVVGSLDQKAVIVFIDDLDRCLPDTVVDTFEVIRLFLNTPKTAYVLALNQNVVEAAVDKFDFFRLLFT